jgi:hypothetical protein
MKDTKSPAGQNKEKFFASFQNRQPGAAIKYIEVTVICDNRQQAKEIAKAELIPLSHYTFQEID